MIIRLNRRLTSALSTPSDPDLILLSARGPNYLPARLGVVLWRSGRHFQYVRAGVPRVELDYGRLRLRYVRHAFRSLSLFMSLRNIFIVCIVAVDPAAALPPVFLPSMARPCLSPII